MLWFREEPMGEKYRKLIEYAMKKSDAFLLAYEYPRKLDIEVNRIKSFQDRLAPYLIKKRNEVYWKDTIDYNYSGRICNDPGGKNCVEIYRATLDALPILYEPDALYRWFVNYGYPTDLSFYKYGVCWFASICHESDAALTWITQDDTAFFRSIGINYLWDNSDDENTIYGLEDYSL